MKKLLIVVFCLLMFSCAEYKIQPTWKSGTLTVIGKEPFKTHWYGDDNRVYLKLDDNETLFIRDSRFSITHEVGWASDVKYRYYYQDMSNHGDGRVYGVMIKIGNSPSILNTNCAPFSLEGFKKSSSNEILGVEE